jgi:hypothetical protein
MPRRRKHRHIIPANLRKKCEDTGTVKQVNHRHITIPANFTSPKKEGFKFEDIPGVVIKNYHTTEGAEEAHGETSFVNHYDEEQFLRP